MEGDFALAPDFLAPPNLDYVGYHKYIDEMLPPESPILYGLHPNAEIDFLTILTDNLFKTLLELQPRNLLAGEVAGQSSEDKVSLNGFLETHRCTNLPSITEHALRG